MMLWIQIIEIFNRNIAFLQHTFVLQQAITPMSDAVVEQLDQLIYFF